MKLARELTLWKAKDFERLATMLTIILVFLGLAAFLNLAGVASIGREGVKTGIEVVASVKPEQALRAEVFPTQVNAGGQPVEVTVAVQPSGVTEHLYSRAMHVPLILLVMAVVFLLRRIFKDAAQDRIFVRANASRLRKMAVLLFCTVFLEYFSQVAANELARTIIGPALVVPSFHSSFIPMAAASLLLALAAIFDRGIALQEENEATI